MASLSKLPLLQLPYLVIREVLLCFQFGDLIHFSFSSKRIHRIIKSMRITLEEFIIRIRKGGVQIIMRSVNGCSQGGWYFNQAEFIEKIKRKGVKTVLNGLQMKAYSRHNDLRSYTDGNLRYCVKRGIEYVEDLFRCPLPTIFYFPDGMRNSVRPSLIGINECTDLTISGKKELENDELEMILDKLKGTWRLRLMNPIKKDFKFDVRICNPIDNLVVNKHAHWITSEMFLSLRSKKIHFGNCCLTANDCRTFVKRWYESDDTEFDYLTLHWTIGVPQDLNFDGLGLELREFDPELRHPFFRVYDHAALRMTNGKDFIRKDGLLASVAVYQNLFRFCVFKDRFRSTDGAKIY